MKLYILHNVATLINKTGVKAVIAIAFFTTAFFQTSQAQDTTTNTRLMQVLQTYYGIKDALVAGNSVTASANATSFIKNLNVISYKIISEGNVNALLKDAGAIADATDIKTQRAVFTHFSTNVAELAKGLKLTDQPIYLQYCPMAKASWLSNEKNIRNPYYGSAMLTCGKVTDTIQ